jgi:hypothetical protein
MTDEVLDRRAAIEAAFDSEEAKAEASLEPAHAPEASPPAVSGESSPAPVHEGIEKPPVDAEGEPSTAPEHIVPVEKAPQSWRAPQKAKWDKLDPDIRQEVMRREREITKTLGETAQARQFTNQFSQAIQPYAARLQSMGAHPIKAVAELLKSDHILSSGTKNQRATMIAKLINDYDVDVRELDSVLSGQAPADPVESKVEQLLAQRLAPFQQYITQAQQREAQREQLTNRELGQTIEQMASDPKFPFFEDVREDMGDIIDLQAKKGVYLSLEQAYTRAVAMNPEVSAQVAAQRDAEAKRAAALEAHNKAQKALKASVSVGGSPGGVPSGTSVASDRRATIAAAFDALGGR